MDGWEYNLLKESNKRLIEKEIKTKKIIPKLNEASINLFRTLTLKALYFGTLSDFISIAGYPEDSKSFAMVALISGFIGLVPANALITECKVEDTNTNTK